MDKAWYVEPYNGVLLSNKKGQTTQMCNNMNEFQTKTSSWVKEAKH